MGNTKVGSEELQTFVEIAYVGEVSPAALRFDVTKSTDSRRIARLEAELGIQLLTRSTRETALTTTRDYAARVVCAETDVAREAILYHCPI